MTLVSLIEPVDADPSVRAPLDAGMEQYGQALHTWRALLHRPPIFAAYLPYLRAVVGAGEVPQRTKELSALAVAIANRCRYSASHRYRAAQAAGVADAEVEALARGDIDAFADPAERLAIEYARQLTLRPSEVPFGENPQAVDPQLLDALKAAFSEPQLVELTANIALWNALARFHRVMGFPLDMPPPPQAVEAAL
ncbi:MAG TPA: carboxymuconolactone decarboxylase family protein [Candidatus Limnocylindria bacterium]|nr:carboxymuconolactone decarboxylase family protein [Candidatus Limnocylindria bacterium]